MLEYKVIKLKNKDIEVKLTSLLNEEVEKGWKFVGTQTVTNYLYRFSSDVLVIFSKEK